MLNHIDLMGRLTADPELRKTQSDKSVVTFTIACDRDFGEKTTDFISCVAWQQTGEFIKAHFRKGNLIVLSGRLQSRKWQDNEGNNRTSWEINVERGYFSGERNSVSVEPPKFTEEPADDGELPF